MTLTAAQAAANITAAVKAPVVDTQLTSTTRTSSTPLMFLDTETTGIHADRRVWEVAMIRRDSEGERERRFFVKTVDLSTADPYGLRVGGFYDRHPQYADLDRPVSAGQLVERYDAAREVERWTRGAIIIGAVPSFDTEVLAKMLRSLNLTPAWDYHLIDVESLALGWLAGRGIPAPTPWRSEQLALLCGVEPATDADRHTALGDARWVMRWYDAITTQPETRETR